MKKQTFVALLLLGPFLSFAQWEWQNPLPQGNDLNDVFFVDQYTGWSVGDHGTIVRTRNSGETFEVLPSTTFEHLNAVEFFSSYFGFAVGNRGTLLETHNGGDSWENIDIGVNADLLDLCLCFPNKIWIAADGGTVLVSEDGGNSFQCTFSDPLISLNSICFLDADNGWAAGRDDAWGSVVLRSLDGGFSWAELTGGIFPYFSVIHFTGPDTGWAIANGWQVYETDDGGYTWEPHFEDPGGGLSLPSFSDIYCADDKNGWIVGAGSYIPVTNTVIGHTQDGGESWEYQSCEAWNGLTEVYFVDGEHGCAVGNLGNIVLTENCGDEWMTACGAYERAIYHDVFFTDNEHGFVAGGFFYPFISELSRTSDGGVTWEELEVPYHHYCAIHFIDHSEGWVAGGGFVSASYSDNVVIHTVDGGSSWEVQYQGDGNPWFYTFRDICFANTERGWVVGGTQSVNPPMNPIFLQTEDGGETWEDISSLTVNSLNAITFPDSLHGWIAGHATLLHTSDGGESWMEAWSGIHSLNDVFFIDNDHGWLIGDSLYHEGPDVVMYTDDGGLSWETQYFDLDLNGIFFTDPNTGYIISSQGVILVTQDGGETWEEQVTGCSADLHGIFFSDADNGWLVGYNGTILHTGNGGISTGTAYQNSAESVLQVDIYPNPFSGATTIAYDLDDPGIVSLTFYDQVGRKVNEVNGVWQNGFNEFFWRPEHLQNGIYYFVLEAGAQIVSGKVILLR